MDACQEGVPATLRRYVTAPCLQVLYTMPSSSSSKDDAIISESGAMNVFFLLDKVAPRSPACMQSSYIDHDSSLCMTNQTSHPACISDAHGGGC